MAVTLQQLDASYFEVSAKTGFNVEESCSQFVRYELLVYLCSTFECCSHIIENFMSEKIC